MRTRKGIILVLTIILMVCFSAAALAETSPVTDGEFNFDVDVLHDQTPSGSKHVCGIYADGKTVTDQGTHNVTAKSNQSDNSVYGIYAINGGTITVGGNVEGVANPSGGGGSANAAYGIMQKTAPLRFVAMFKR